MITANIPTWMTSLYDDVFADVMLDRQPGADEVQFLLDTLRLGAGNQVLDQGCGVGSMAIALAARGIHVTGIDIIPAYVARARAGATGLPASFHEADACGYVTSTPIDAAYSWWTSWGHAGTDDANLAMLERVYESLRPGGVFMLDTMNVASILRLYQPVLIRHREVPSRGGQVTIRRDCGIDFMRGEISTLWRFQLPDGSTTATNTTMRMYMPHDIVAMLRAAGFADIQLFGGIAGEPLEMDSHRVVVVAIKP